MNILEIVKALGQLLLVLENNHFAAVVVIALAAIASITAIVWQRPGRR